MGSARRLLLVAVLGLAIAADARTSATLSTLTLSPTADSLITTRSDSTKNDSPSTPAVIGSAESDTNKATQAPATLAPATTVSLTSKTTDPPSTTAPPTNRASESTSASDSEEQNTAEKPAKVSPSDRSSLDSVTQTDAPPATSTSSKSSTASVDSLNDSNGGISAGNTSSGSMGTLLPACLGALACVGAVVMAVTYKRKRDVNGDDNDNRPSSDCEYTGGGDFTPENRTLNTVQEGNTPSSISVDVVPPFTNSSVGSTSPFGTTRSKVRVSSPAANYFSSSEPNMEFQDTCLRHEGGSNVVLTFDEVPTDSRRGAPQVQL
ncbi:hypothetical protein GN244_ATG07790 [Phytophthora infestans]|uniref:Uncharacterized protein n=1 Tax=Phytophthora infestans TaxID=4787 RepID=A0A833W2M8_PHYIN|nr:hypothetical protein GN244_ATG07790 [Phytophthora infestans]KAI9996654.1 hypothetical protein PInf_014395 [Phytophthora infestans]